jgi:choice-of-anchor C domain-containing protein
LPTRIEPECSAAGFLLLITLMRTSLWVLLAGLGLGISAPGATIQNGSFEELQIGSSYVPFFTGADLGGHWIVESGSVEIVRDYWPAAEGHQSIDLSGVFEDVGTIYQDVATVPGRTYKIKFAMAGNPEDPGTDKRMKVFWNDGEVADLTYNTAGRSLSDMGWRYHSYTVTATGEVSRIKFRSLTISFLGPVIDDVSIEELPTVGSLRNGSFEDLAIGSSYVAFGTGADIGGGWIVEDGTVEIVRDYWNAAEGHQSVDLSGIYEQAGTIYQDITTVPGQKYTVRFAFAGNPEDAGGADKRLKVFWNSDELADLTMNTAGRSFTNMGWQYYSYPVTATGTTSRLKFQSLTFNFLGPVIDDVSVRPISAATLDVELVARVTVTGLPGDRYRIEYMDRSENNWQPLANVTIPPSGKTFALDADGVHGNRRLYRATLITGLE